MHSPKINMAPVRRPSQKETYLLTPVKKASQMVDGVFFDRWKTEKNTPMEDVSTATISEDPHCWNDNLPDPPVQIRYEKRQLVSMMQKKHTGYSVHCTS